MNGTQILVEWVAFQAVWFVCAVGASYGHTAPGVMAAAVFSCGVLAQRRWDLGEVLIVLSSGIIGAIVETLFVANGFVSFSAPWPNVKAAPAWIVALWVAFGATLPTIAALFGNRFVLKAFGTGLVGGPLAYWAGARLGALDIAEPVLPFYAAAALIWGAALPALLALRVRLHRS